MTALIIITLIVGRLAVMCCDMYFYRRTYSLLDIVLVMIVGYIPLSLYSLTMVILHPYKLKLKTLAPFKRDTWMTRKYSMKK